MSAPSLTAKLSQIASHCEALVPARPSFGDLRAMLGRQRVLILPHIKSHSETILPGDGPERARATVLVEIDLIDAEHAEQLTTRWIGQAEDAPMIATDKAVTRAMEDFLTRTFLLFKPSHASPPLAADPAPSPAAATTPRSPSSVRRQPHGAPLASPRATPPALPAEPARAAARPSAGSAQLDLLELAARAVNEDAPSEPLPPLTKEWKSANALWRALVNEVAGAETMEAFEDALERQHQVDSWRRLTAAQIRAVCLELNKRSALAPNSRLLSDREEFILAQLPLVPEGSSLNRLRGELERLVTSCVDEATSRSFIALYLERMNAERLSEVPGKAAIALTRKLRRLSDDKRERFVLDALKSARAKAPQEDTAA